MTSSHLLPLHDAYNAKWTDPQEVARSFVMPDQFAMVQKRRNSLIVGPRGSGKTTLLKMLTEPAMDAWAARRAGPAPRELEYTGVFIATDVSWNAQVSALGSPNLAPAVRGRLQTSALRVHAFEALATAMDYRLERLKAARNWTILELREIEARLVGTLAAQWALSPHLPSFLSLRSALRLRLQEVHSLADRLLSHQDDSLPVWCSGRPVMVDCSNAVREFNDIAGQQGFWAFLFDETELMPQSLRQELYAFLRTITGPLVLKLAFSPFDRAVPMEAPAGGPQPGHDFDLVPLWYPRKQKAYDFCRRLWRELVVGTSLQGVSVATALGRSLISVDAGGQGEGTTAYRSTSKRAGRFRQLADTDPSFQEYLTHNKIDLTNLESLSGTQRASTLRKIFPIVVSRLEYRRPLSGGDALHPHLRSRKQSPLYIGDPALFEVCEGNPREFIGLVSRMLARVHGEIRRIPDQVQMDEVSQAVARFTLLCKTRVLALDEPSRRGDTWVTSSSEVSTVAGFVDRIATALQDAAYRAPFQAEPPGSFVVHESTPADLVDLVGEALNIGAIVHVTGRAGEEEVLSPSTVRGKRFRLSYLVAAGYGLLPRLGRAVDLTAIVPLTSGQAPATPDQGRLFEGMQS